MSNVDKDTVIENFISAYKEIHNVAPSIEAKSGWYSINGDKNVRLSAIEEMTHDLQCQLHSKTKPTSNTNKKRASEGKAAKTASTSASKKQKTFSVKDFYNKQILEMDPKATVPR